MVTAKPQGSVLFQSDSDEGWELVVQQGPWLGLRALILNPDAEEVGAVALCKSEVKRLCVALLVASEAK